MKALETASEKTEIQEFDYYRFFYDLMKNFKKLWWTALFCVLVCTIFAFAFSRILYHPMYQSSATFTIIPLNSSSSTNGTSRFDFSYNATMGEQMAATFPYIIESENLLDVVKNDLNREINGTITASAEPETNLFTVTVTSNSSSDAYSIVESVIKNYPQIAEYILGDTQMNILQQPEISTEPYNARYYVRYTAYGTTIGFFIAIAVLVLATIRRKTIITRRDIEVGLNGTCICEIPFVINKRRAKAEGVLLTENIKNPNFSEAFRTLKKRLRNTLSEGEKVICVTSAVSGEGKTTVAYNLASSLAGSGAKVLLVDMDFHRRNLQHCFEAKKKIEIPVGITDVASGRAELVKSIYGDTENLYMLFAGTAEAKFRKTNYEAIFGQLREHFQYIVVDTPPCGVASEAATIADLCDAIVFAVKFDFASVDRIISAFRYIAFSKAKFSGFVLNGATGNYNDYYNGYYARFYGRHYGKYSYYNHSYAYGGAYGEKAAHRKLGKTGRFPDDDSVKESTEFSEKS